VPPCAAGPPLLAAGVGEVHAVVGDFERHLIACPLPADAARWVSRLLAGNSIPPVAQQRSCGRAGLLGPGESILLASISVSRRARAISRLRGGSTPRR